MKATTRQALLVIDIQNDYFPGGRYELWEAENTLVRIVSSISQARERKLPIFLIQHVGSENSPFFTPGSTGADIHPRLLAAAPEAPIIVKRHADSFLETSLAASLAEHAVNELLICGMMTQNCVTFSALSRQAEGYAIKVLADCCTTVSRMLHQIALNALATRVEVVPGLP